MDKVDALVIGGGVVGIACALSLARRGHEVLILEADATFGSGISSRNSEVIHAGLYYPESSLKARLCVRGRELLYEFCESRGVPHRRIGKLIFAGDESEFPTLEKIRLRAAAGATELQWLSRDEVRRMEPVLDAAGALHSPMTGIVDSHALMLAMLAEIEALGGSLVCRSPVGAVGRHRDGWAVSLAGEHEPVLSARMVVCAAGLGAQELAARIEGLDIGLIPRRVMVRGCYFGYSGKVPFSRLIYPVPVPGGLGTHLTLGLDGSAKFGPNVEPVESEDYSVDPARHSHFLAAARRIWPGIDPARLHPAYAGIRPKIAVPAGTEGDFDLAGPGRLGLPGLVVLSGIESPGLTASLAIGEEVSGMLEA